jgi:hypothetical protein
MAGFALSIEGALRDETHLVAADQRANDNAYRDCQVRAPHSQQSGHRSNT